MGLNGRFCRSAQTSDKALHFKRDAGLCIVRDSINEATSLLIF